ncbi:porin [Stakelama marina]|uniref:Porin n=1 Tax=Stakelama marina TaxID=2826939 RepID=A0A8T4IEL3_9SPHN|nr:porin [Stakelama marina]MBR0553000.1 porin [Stakelama marina]
MNTRHLLAGLGLTALLAGGVTLAPALDARETPARSASMPDMELGTFTPASVDPKLAAVLQKSGIDSSDFRFTPSDAKETSSRSVSVTVHASKVRGKTDTAERASATTPAMTLAPIAYNLGASVGWKRFTVTGDVSKLDLAGAPGSREQAEVGVNYQGKKFTGSVKAGASRPLPDEPVMIADDSSYSIEAGGSYKLTHNLDVTAGVRYKSEEQRLPRLAAERRDSQAVYIGTAFRF